MAVAVNRHTNSERNAPYSVIDGAKRATAEALDKVGNQLPADTLRHIGDVVLVTATDGSQIYFPCPFKETEAIVALKSIEACAVAAIADLRFGEKKRSIKIDLEKTAAFLFSTYIATIGGIGKQDLNVKAKLKGDSRPF